MVVINHQNLTTYLGGLDAFWFQFTPHPQVEEKLLPTLFDQ